MDSNLWFLKRLEYIEQGRFIKQLVKDKDREIRLELAKAGYELDTLVHDEDYRVNNTARLKKREKQVIRQMLELPNIKEILNLKQNPTFEEKLLTWMLKYYRKSEIINNFDEIFIESNLHCR